MPPLRLPTASGGDPRLIAAPRAVRCRSGGASVRPFARS